MSCSNIPADFYDGCNSRVIYTWLTKEDYLKAQESSRKYEAYSKEYLVMLMEQMVEDELYEDAAEVRDEITMRNLGAI